MAPKGLSVADHHVIIIYATDSFKRGNQNSCANMTRSLDFRKLLSSLRP